MKNLLLSLSLLIVLIVSCKEEEELDPETHYKLSPPNWLQGKWYRNKETDKYPTFEVTSQNVIHKNSSDGSVHTSAAKKQDGLAVTGKKDKTGGEERYVLTFAYANNKGTTSTWTFSELPAGGIKFITLGTNWKLTK